MFVLILFKLLIQENTFKKRDIFAQLITNVFSKNFIKKKKIKLGITHFKYKKNNYLNHLV